MKFRNTSKREDLKAYGAGHHLETPSTWLAGVVFTSPHSGNIYPNDLLKRTKLSAHQLRRNEDIYVDHLFHSVIDAGAPLLKALFPRAVVDVNRDASELPEHWAGLLTGDARRPITARAAAGLGVIPTYLTESLPIYTRQPSEKDVSQRLSRLYHPYHKALADIIARAKSRFGRALLIDCHSMPGFAPMGSRRPDIILGDRFGTSCHSDTLQQIQALFSQAGYSVGINYPYAGGYTTSHYGAPALGVEAIQIEINRDLYVNPITLSPKSDYMRLKDNLRHITSEIIAAARPQDLAAQ